MLFPLIQPATFYDEYNSREAVKRPLKRRGMHPVHASAKKRKRRPLETKLLASRIARSGT